MQGSVENEDKYKFCCFECFKSNMYFNKTPVVVSLTHDAVSITPLSFFKSSSHSTLVL